MPLQLQITAIFTVFSKLLFPGNKSIKDQESLERTKLDISAYLAYIVYMGEILLRNVPEDLRRDFKILCIKNGTNMTEAILKFMKKEVEKAAQKG